MADVFVNYDVDSRHVEIKQAMINKGYFKTWKSDGVTYYLPNTSVWKPDTSTETGLSDIQSVCRSLSVKLFRAIAVPASPWSAIPGEDFNK